MTTIHKILLTLYFTLWTLCLGLLYAQFTDRFYATGILFGNLLGALSVIVALLTLLTLIVLYWLRPEKRRLNKKLMGLVLLPALGLLPWFVINVWPNPLENKVHTIRVTYIAYACECASWRVVRDNGKPMNTEDIFLEPLNSQLQLPDAIGYNGDMIELTGKFYTRKGFPKDYDPGEQIPEKARLFQYTQYKIVHSNQAEVRPQIGKKRKRS